MIDIEKMIEAGARAIHDTDDMADTVWPDSAADDGYRGGSAYVRVCQDTELYRQAARACLTAAQAEWRAQGAVLAVVPDKQKRAETGGLLGAICDANADGWNEAIAAMRAAEVGL